MSSLRILKSLSKNSSKLLISKNSAFILKTSTRGFGVGAIISRVLKLRYLILGGAVGGGVAIHNVS